MKKIFEGEVYDVLPLNNGIIFSYCKESTEENVTVSYKMISFEDGRITDVAKNIYLMTKYGSNYKTIIKHAENYITTKAIILPSGKVFMLLTDGTAKLVDIDSTVVWQGRFNYRTFNASDVVIHKNSIWACFPDCDVLLRYNLNTMREELRIGGNKSPFNKPRSMFLEGDCAMVCNRSSQNLVKVNLENYIVLEDDSFPEEVLQYIKVDIYRFIVLKSGLYMI